jgi:hypothetical protein
MAREGKLPWSTAPSEAQLLQLKERCDIVGLCKEHDCNEVPLIKTIFFSLKFLLVTLFENPRRLLKLFLRVERVNPCYPPNIILSWIC